MRVTASWKIATIATLALATGACKGGPGPLGPTGPTGPTGPMLPAVTWISPIDGAGSVPLDGVVRAAFTKDMDPTTITAANFQLAAGGTTATATVSYNAGNRTAFLAPSAPLASFARYTVTLSTAVKDTGGNALPSAYSWSFWTSGSFSHSTLYLGCFANQIQVFNAPAFLGGAQVPDRSISVTGLGSGPGIWLDTATDRLFVLDFSATPQIFVVNSASTANGTVTAARTIVGAATGLANPLSAWLDPVNNRLYVNNYDFGGASQALLVFNGASTATGNVAPARTIAGPSTGLGGPIFLPWLDVLTDQLYVSNAVNNSITIFANASTATGNVAPARTISGPLTTLSFPTTLWLDKASDRLYVANATSGRVLVFDSASTATGNIAPSRTIAVTALSNSLYGLWLDAATDRLYVSNFSGANVVVYNGASTLTGTPTPARTINTCGGGTIMFDPGN